jgi:hypothetical protein
MASSLSNSGSTEAKVERFLAHNRLYRLFLFLMQITFHCFSRSLPLLRESS